jgi:GT2 family glycosyltransferase
VLDLELDAEPPGGLGQYVRALVLFRWRGRPVASTYLPVVNGAIPPAAWRQASAAARGAQASSEAAVEAPGQLPRATIAICTRNRPEQLRGCLDSLVHLLDSQHEILVIDNDPTDRAGRRVVEAFPGVRYVLEPRPGLSAARNRALREAAYDLVAFTDDDARPDADWPRALLTHFADRRVLCVTGLTLPLELETAAQEWFEARFPYGRGFRGVVYECRQGALPTPGRPGAGVNMALRREVLARIGPFDPALGAGTPARSGEDNDLFTRILRAGYRIVYEPGALVWHRHRRDWSELRRTLFGYRAGLFATWTKEVLAERQFGSLWLAGRWLICHQAPILLRSLRAPYAASRPDLRLAELLGCLAGPWLYLSAVHRSRAAGRR